MNLERTRVMAPTVQRPNEEKIKPVSSEHLWPYVIVDALIACIFSCICLYREVMEYRSTDWNNLSPAICMSAITSAYGCLGLLVDDTYFLSINCLRLFLMAFVSVKFGFSRFFLDTDWDLGRLAVTVLCLLILLPFYSLGVMLFANHIAAVRSKRVRMRLKPGYDVVLIIYTVLDFVVSTSLCGLYFYRNWVSSYLNWDLLLPFLILLYASAFWFTGLAGLIGKDEYFLDHYCDRLLAMGFCSAMWGVSRFFLTTDWPGERANVMVVCLAYLLPFYAFGMTLFPAKVTALQMDKEEGKQEQPTQMV